MNFFNTSLIFTPEVFILCRKVLRAKAGGRKVWYTHSELGLFKKCMVSPKKPYVNKNKYLVKNCFSTILNWFH